jgi:hypothetical protein
MKVLAELHIVLVDARDHLNADAELISAVRPHVPITVDKRLILEKECIHL